MIDVVLPIFCIDHGAVSHGPFNPQGRGLLGGGRVGRTVITDCLAAVLASGVRIVGSMGTAGDMRVAGLIGGV